MPTASHRLAHLADITSRLSAALTLNEVVDVVLQHVPASIGADGGALVLSDSSDMHVTRMIGFSEAFTERWRNYSRGGHTPGLDALNAKAPVFIETHDEWSARYPEHAAAMVQEGFEGYAAIPLVYGNDAIGVLTFNSRGPRAYTEAERDYLRAIAAHCAQAIERARLFDAEREARRRAEQLQTITAALASARSLAEIGAFFSRDLRLALEADTVWLGVVPPNGTAIEAIGWSGYAPEGEMLIRETPRISLAANNPMAIALREALPQWWESREALAEAYPDLRQDIMKVRREAIALLPLIAGESRVGGITIGFSDRRRFDANLRHFLVILARQCTLAVQRAHAFEREREAREDAQRANRAKTDFLARMSHELRTPLNAISGYAQLLEMEVHGPLSDRQRDALIRIQRSQDHLLGLIDQLLTHSKLEANSVTYDLTSVSLSSAVAEVRDIVSPLVSRKRLTFECAVPGDGMAVIADATRLRQILINLLTNAVKFTDARDGKPGRIEIWCAQDNGDATHERRVRIHVRDNGPGVAPSDLERIFQPFIQGDESLTRAVGGVGLGLAISRELARAMGGDLTVESTVGEGSVFTLSLSAASPPVSAGASIAASMEPPPLVS